MRLVHVVTAGLLLVPVAVLAQHSGHTPSSDAGATHSSPAPAPTPDRSSTTSSSSVSSSHDSPGFSSSHSTSSSENTHSSSVSHSTASSEGGSASVGGHDSDHHHNHDTSFPTSRQDNQAGTQTAQHPDFDRDTRHAAHESHDANEVREVKAARADHHAKSWPEDKTSSSAAHSQIERTHEYEAKGAAGPVKSCDKEPCKASAPPLKVSPEDWRLGRCKEGPCEPCPPGSHAGKYGTCVNPTAAPTAPYATAAQNSAWQQDRLQCSLYSSQKTSAETDFRLAEIRADSACMWNSDTAECTFAKMDRDMAQQRCQMVFVPSGCSASSPLCI